MKNSYPKALAAAFLFFIAFTNHLSAQQAEEWKGYVNPDPIRAHQELILRNSQNTSKVTEFTGSDYDVKFYKLELRLNPDSSTAKYVRGKITTYFTTGTANFSLIKFDMASPLSCDSAYYHGVKLSAGSISKTVDTLSVTLPNIPVAGTLDSVTVYYKGVPPVVSAWTSTGFVKSTHGSAPVKNYIYTLSEPYSSYTWWPCKSFQVNDKADSADIIVSTPTTFKVAANGKLISEVTSGSNLITTWQERYPISAYQICVGVANYTVYNSPNVMVGSTSMPVYHYIFPETNTAAAQTALDKTPTMITAFNSLFGDYPFKNEKYGHYTFGFSGGMEHNTFSGMSSGTYNQTSDWDIIAHELGHQWWGGSVTNASWHDIWLHESFADYSERLCAEFAPSVLPGGTTALSWQQMKKTNSMSASYQAQSTYVTDTSSILTIFTPSVYIYDRGGMAINMLRKTMGDTKFFQALKNYQADPALKYKTAFTSDMQYHMENVSGLNLTDFFNDWIYGKGVASYNLEWNSTGNNVFFRFTQSRPYAGSPSYFDMPVVIRIQGSLVSQDTTIVAYDDNGLMNFDNNGVMTTWGTNMLGYNLSFAPVTITFDPYSDMLANGTVTKNTSLTSTLPVQFIGFSGKREGNKAKLNWEVDNSESYALFEVQRSTDRTSFETIGKLTAENQQGIVQYNFTDENLGTSAAYYRIKVITNNGNAVYSKTVYLEGGQFNLRIKVTPNPASENVVISNLPENSNVTVRIIDTRGVVLQQTGGLTVTNTRVTVPVSDVANGIYFIEVITKDGKSVSQVLVRH